MPTIPVVSAPAPTPIDYSLELPPSESLTTVGTAILRDGSLRLTVGEKAFAVLEVPDARCSQTAYPADSRENGFDSDRIERSERSWWKFDGPDPAYLQLIAWRAVVWVPKRDEACYIEQPLFEIPQPENRGFEFEVAPMGRTTKSRPIELYKSGAQRVEISEDTITVFDGTREVVSATTRLKHPRCGWLSWATDGDGRVKIGASFTDDEEKENESDTCRVDVGVSLDQHEWILDPSVSPPRILNEEQIEGQKILASQAPHTGHRTFRDLELAFSRTERDMVTEDLDDGDWIATCAAKSKEERVKYKAQARGTTTRSRWTLTAAGREIAAADGAHHQIHHSCYEN